MSGLTKNTGRKIFVNIKTGKLVVKKDNVVEEYGAIEGLLTGVFISTKEYQGQEYEQLSLMIVDGTDTYELQMRFDSGYGRGFCYTILNAKLDKPIKFSPKFSEKDGKKESWLFLNQYDQPLKRAFTKDNPNGLPQMEKKTFKGKDMWDNTNQIEFWRSMINDKIRPNLIHPALAEGANESKAGLGTAEGNGYTPQDITEPVDDLPF